jgi:hypothetical protein
MEENKKLIKQYEEFAKDIEIIIDKVDNDKILNRRQRTRLIEFLDKAVLHINGMISVLNGSYKKDKNIMEG